MEMAVAEKETWVGSNLLKLIVETSSHALGLYARFEICGRRTHSQRTSHSAVSDVYLDGLLLQSVLRSSIWNLAYLLLQRNLRQRDWYCPRPAWAQGS